MNIKKDYMDKNKLDFIYPNGARNALTLRFDHGLIWDRETV